MPIYIGAALIAASILLSTFINSLTTRYAGLNGVADESMWLVDRLTGAVYRCQASERGRAVCEPEMATGSVGERPKAGR